MVAYSYVLLLAGALFQTNVLASPVPTPDNIQSGWVDSAFVTCMKKAVPGYPTTKPTNPKVVNGCRPGSKKRDVFDVEEVSLDSRQLPTFTMPTADVVCDGGFNGPLPKNFMIVTDIRGGAVGYCNQMKADIIASGVGYINSVTNNAVTKTADELHGGKGVLLNMLFSLTPQGQALIQAGKVSSDALQSVCVQAVTMIATKGQGCTTDINWYNAGAAKGETSTGAKGGSMLINMGSDIFAMLSNEFLSP